MCDEGRGRRDAAINVVGQARAVALLTSGSQREADVRASSCRTPDARVDAHSPFHPSPQLFACHPHQASPLLISKYMGDADRGSSREARVRRPQEQEQEVEEGVKTQRKQEGNREAARRWRQRVKQRKAESRVKLLRLSLRNEELKQLVRRRRAVVQVLKTVVLSHLATTCHLRLPLDPAFARRQPELPRQLTSEPASPSSLAPASSPHS